MLQQQDLKRIKLIGEGAFGKVYYGKLRDTRFNKNAMSKSVAIKDISLNFSVISKDEILKKIQVFNKELDLVEKFTNEFLINCYGYVIYDDKLSLVIEYCDGRALKDYFENITYNLSVRQKLQTLIDTANALEFIHSLGIIHKDIKSMNILLKYFIKDKNTEVLAKLADFGISQTLEEIEQSYSGVYQNIGTTQWMSPEDLRNEKPGFKSDIYSFAIMIWEIFSERVPYADNLSEDGDPLAPYQLIYLVAEENLRPRMDLLKEDTPPEIIEFLPNCWHQDPDQRPSLSDIFYFLKNLIKNY